MQAEAFQQLVEIARPAGGHGRRLQRVLQNQIPTDHEGDQLAERQIRVRIGGAGNRCHRGELRIAQARKAAADGGEQEGHAQCRSRGERAFAGEHEDAGADDGADAQHGQVEVFSVRFSGVDSETSWSTDFLRNRSMVVRFPVIVSKMGWTGRISGTLARLNARNQKGRGDMRNSLVYGKCKKHCRTKS